MSEDDFMQNSFKGPKLTLAEINKELDLLIKKKQNKEVSQLFNKNQKLQIKTLNNVKPAKNLLSIPIKKIQDLGDQNYNKNFFGLDNKFSFKKIN
jgi:hypothetical protein